MNILTMCHRVRFSVNLELAIVRIIGRLSKIHPIRNPFYDNFRSFRISCKLLLATCRVLTFVSLSRCINGSHSASSIFLTFSIIVVSTMGAVISFIQAIALGYAACSAQDVNLVNRDASTITDAITKAAYSIAVSSSSIFSSLQLYPTPSISCYQ